MIQTNWLQDLWGTVTFVPLTTCAAPSKKQYYQRPTSPSPPCQQISSRVVPLSSSSQPSFFLCVFTGFIHSSNFSHCGCAGLTYDADKMCLWWEGTFLFRPLEYNPLSTCMDNSYLTKIRLLFYVYLFVTFINRIVKYKRDE